jgi:hypothetical protein
MTIPIDLPGGEYLPELNSPSLQAGIARLGPSQYRGIVLVDGGYQPSFSCLEIRATELAAICDAQEFIATQAAEAYKQRRD